MSASEQSSGWFSTTHWSVVVQAGLQGSPQAEAALAKLCQTYWYPLYTYIRRSGKGAEDAQDLTQEFFARLIENNFVAAADREKGRFRSFLLTMLKRLLANEWDRANRQKRGGGRVILSLNAETSEKRFLAEPADDTTPEKAYDKRWALTLLESARDRLRQEMVAAGKGAQFEQLKPFLSGETGEGDYSAAAAALNMSLSAVATAGHRLRQKYREAVRAEIADTLANPAEVDEEMRHLLAALG